MAAPDELSLDRALKATQIWVTEAEVAKSDAADASAAAHVNGGPQLSSKRRRRALIEFCSIMGYQTKVGVPLVQGIEALAEQYDDRGFQIVLSGLKEEIESGLPLSDAMAKYHRTFSTEFIGIIRAGELSGDLPNSLMELKRYYTWVDRLVSDVKQATVYPAIVVTVICLFAVFLFAFIVPTFANLLTKLNVPMPLVTQLVFGVGAFAKQYWWIVLLTIGGITLGLQLGRRWSPAVARRLDWLKLQLPLFGPLNHMLALSRFANNLVILYRAGIPILRALEICREVVANILVAEAVDQVQATVEDGSTLSEAVRQATIFPPLVLRMIVVGEASGNLDATLQEVADYYNQTVPERTKKMLTFLEPALMLALIFLVMIVALAIYLPIVDLVGNIK